MEEPKETEKNHLLNIKVIVGLIAIALFIGSLFLSGEMSKSVPTPTDACIGCFFVLLFGLGVGFFGAVLIIWGLMSNRKSK